MTRADDRLAALEAEWAQVPPLEPPGAEPEPWPPVPVDQTASVGSVGSSWGLEPAGSARSVGPVGSFDEVPNRVRAWLGRFICTVQDADLDLLTLWALHTHLADDVYTTPRLLIDSPVPGSGKTTALEHLNRLCRRPLQAASLTSPAMLARLLDQELRTLLIDEADRNLDPKRPGVEDLLAVLNAGYKRGGTRPVLIPGPKGEWNVKEMTTFCPVVLAGNSPHLPEDTRSRVIRVLLLPDLEGRVETSDWEEIEPDAVDLGAAVAEWAELVRDKVRTTRPALPEGCIGRTKERWHPLRRIAEAAGGRWPDIADDLIRRDIEEAAMDKEDGMTSTPPAVTLLRHLAAVWPEGEVFAPSRALVAELIAHDPTQWGEGSTYGRALTVQRMGRMLALGFKVNSARQGDGPRGYYRQALGPVWRRMGIAPPVEPTEPPGPAEPADLW